MKERLLAPWNLARILRLVLGVFIIFQGIDARDWLFVGIGIVFSLLPLLNIGGCGVNGCAVPTNNSKNDVQDVAYKEVQK
jgi:hypothetical protein